MAFREVAVTETREVLRAWLSGAGLRRVAEQAGVDRKTARRYATAAAEAGLARDGGPWQLTDELVGQVAEAVLSRSEIGFVWWPTGMLSLRRRTYTG
jgi:hypothetical protein